MRTQSCSRSSSLAPNSIVSYQPNRSTSGSEAEPTAKSWYTQEGDEGSCGIRPKTVLFPLAYDGLWQSPRWGKAFITFWYHSTRIDPGKLIFRWANNSPNQAFLGPHYGDVDDRPVYGPSGFHHPTAIWRGIVAVQLEDPEAREAQPVGKGSEGKTYVAQTSALPFKDKRLPSQVPTCSFTFDCTSDQFRSNWKSGPNHTLRMQTVRHSTERVPEGERHSSREPIADLRSCRNWPWLLPPVRTTQPLFSQPLGPYGGTQTLWYHQRT